MLVFLGFLGCLYNFEIVVVEFFDVVDVISVWFVVFLLFCSFYSEKFICFFCDVRVSGCLKVFLYKVWWLGCYW